MILADLRREVVRRRRASRDILVLGMCLLDPQSAIDDESLDETYRALVWLGNDGNRAKLIAELEKR